MLLQEGQESSDILIACFPALSNTEKKKKKREKSQRKDHFPDKLALIAHIYGTWQGWEEGYFSRNINGVFPQDILLQYQSFIIMRF